jgi:hypothetical protein
MNLYVLKKKKWLDSTQNKTSPSDLNIFLNSETVGYS